MLLNDRQIKELAKAGMIQPFVESLQEKNVVSYGLSSFGYDVRIGDEFLIFTKKARLSPKGIDRKFAKKVKCVNRPLIIRPGEYVLGKSVEYFKMPEDICAYGIGKSTYSRCGLIVNTTLLEPKWEGFIVIELANPTNCEIEVYPNEGILQLLFFKGEPPLVTYADRAGKYQKQVDIVLPYVKS